MISVFITLMICKKYVDFKTNNNPLNQSITQSINQSIDRSIKENYKFDLLTNRILHPLQMLILSKNGLS